MAIVFTAAIVTALALYSDEEAVYEMWNG